MSHQISDPDLVSFTHGSPWGNNSTVQLTAKGKAGSGSVTLNIRGWTCRHTVTNLYTAPPNPAFQAGQDPNTQSTPGCIGSVRVLVITNVAHTIPVHAAYGAAPAQHTIGAVNLNYNQPSGTDPSAALSGAIAEFTGSIAANHSGIIPLFARLSGGALADSLDPSESDRLYVSVPTNFYSRDFEYTLTGTGDNAAFADMLEVETEFAQEAGTGTYNPNGRGVSRRLARGG